MKPLATILIAGLAAVVATYATVKIASPQGAGTAQKSESVYDRVMRTGTIRCGYGISPPAVEKDVNTGKISGMSYDLWQEIGKQLGLKIEWTTEAGWGSFIEDLRSNRYDAFCSGMWPDHARIKFLTLSVPTVYSFLNTYVRADDHRFDNETSLDIFNKDSITVPAVEGDVSVTLVENRFPQAKILALPQSNTVSDMFLSVITKKADVIFVDQAMFASLEKENKGALRRLEKMPPAFVFSSYYGYKKGEYELRDMVDVALRTLIDDGTLERIAHQYSVDYIAADKNYKGR
ncbi:MAG TPA: transporter substrate-binding domain-containing protein [Alphaproteobacteria bacterium]